MDANDIAKALEQLFPGFEGIVQGGPVNAAELLERRLPGDVANKLQHLDDQVAGMAAQLGEKADREQVIQLRQELGAKAPVEEIRDLRDEVLELASQAEVREVRAKLEALERVLAGKQKPNLERDLDSLIAAHRARR